MMMTGSRWGDEEDDLLPPRVESEPDANGVRTIVEWKVNDKGDRVKVTKKVKKVTEVIKISKRVMERRHWEKFGAAANDEDSSNVTYVSHEEVTLEDPNADQVIPGETKEAPGGIESLKGGSIVQCRHCGMVGDHWTLKCPYKDTPMEDLPAELANASQRAESAAATGAAPREGGAGGSALDSAFGSGGRYVPPNMRGGRMGGEGGDRESQDDRDQATLRVTNISPDTREDDLKDLFRAFGPVSRVYLAKDRETFQSRGFAFVSFVYREDAERALNKLQGYGYDHLILKLEWAKPSNKPAQGQGDAGSLTTTFRSGYGKALPQNIAPPPRK